MSYVALDNVQVGSYNVNCKRNLHIYINAQHASCQEGERKSFWKRAHAKNKLSFDKRELQQLARKLQDDVDCACKMWYDYVARGRKSDFEKGGKGDGRRICTGENA